MTQESPAAEQQGSTQLFRAVGLRVTATRVAVLDVLEHRRHVTVDALADEVRGRHGSISTQAVYDVLAALVRTDLVRRIEPAGSPALFERTVGASHHHLVCRTCAAVEDIPRIIGAAACLTPSQSHGFVLDEAEVTFWGLCPDCRPPGAPQ